MPRIVLALIVLAMLFAPAAAHPLDVGYVRIEQNGNSFAIALDLELAAAATALKLDENQLDTAGLAAHAQALADATFARAPITTDAGPCRWSGTATSLTARTVRVSSTATCTGSGVRRWMFPMIKEARISPTFELLVKEVLPDTERLTLEIGRAHV